MAVEEQFPAPVGAFAAVVTDVRLESKKDGRSVWQIALDHSRFGPGDTGQFEAVSRSGARLEVPVLRVDVDAEGTVWHAVEKPLTEGTKITAHVLARGNSLVH